MACGPPFEPSDGGFGPFRCAVGEFVVAVGVDAKTRRPRAQVCLVRAAGAKVAPIVPQLGDIGVRQVGDCNPYARKIASFRAASRLPRCPRSERPRRGQGVALGQGVEHPTVVLHRKRRSLRLVADVTAGRHSMEYVSRQQGSRTGRRCGGMSSFER